MPTVAGILRYMGLIHKRRAGVREPVLPRWVALRQPPLARIDERLAPHKLIFPSSRFLSIPENAKNQKRKSFAGKN